MQGHIAQVVALAIYGNAFLKGGNVTSLWPSGSAFTFCRSVSFVALAGQGKDPEEIPYAQDPLQWLSKLRSEGVVGLRLHHLAGNDPRISDRMSVGFVGGGGRWLIEAVKPAVSDAWEARWQVGDQEDPERRIWLVTYGRTVANHSHVSLQEVGAERLRKELQVVLSEIASFAEKQQLDGFAKCFRAGLEVLGSENPLAKVYHSDLAPPQTLPLAGEQLLSVAQATWVFGGMGSWNDLGFDGSDQQTYESLSDRLFGLLNQAVVEAANSSFDGSGPQVVAEPWWKLWKRRPNNGLEPTSLRDAAQPER